jgi:hypothetical protein
MYMKQVYNCHRSLMCYVIFIPLLAWKFRL